MNAVTDIYRHSIQPSEHQMVKDQYYRRAKNQIKQCYELLGQRLSKYEMSVLDKLLSGYDEKTERKNLYCFQYGFKLGLESAVDALKWDK